MRVTGSMISSTLMRNLYRNLKDLNRYQNQVSSNSKILRLSDDPIGAVSSIQIGTDLSSNEQYSKNISDAKAWLTETESTLSDMNEIVVRAKELAVQAGNGTFDAEQRKAIIQEVEQLQEHYIDLANTKFMGKYIFGGYNTTTAPFKVSTDPDPIISYNSITNLSTATIADIEYENEKEQVKHYKLSKSVTFPVSLSGLEVMRIGEDNVFNLFNGFISELHSDVVTDPMIEYASKFTGVQSKILSLTADVGGRQNRLNLMEERYESENLNLSELQTKVAGIDQAEVITQYKTAENAYNTSLQVGAKIIQMSLVDFLR